MPPKVAQMIKEQEKKEVLNKLKEIGYKFDNYCVYIPNKEKWEKENFERDIWYLIIYHKFEEVTSLEINFKEKTFRKYIERDNYLEAMCPEEEHYEKIDVPLIDEEEEIFYQLGWIKATTKQRKEKEKEQKEQKIFKEFEKFGYEIKINNDDVLQFIVKEEDINLKINKKFKKYEKFYYGGIIVSEHIDLEEHQLLHKLFSIWGWFDE